jgi:hypothetical protein
MYNETTHTGKPSEKISVTVTLFERVQSPDLEGRSSGIASCYQIRIRHWLISLSEQTLEMLYILGPQLVQLMLQDCHIKV